MSNEVKDLKAALRVRIRERLATLSREQRLQASANLCKRMRETEAWKAAKSVLLFAPQDDEPDVWPLLLEAIVEGRTVALPRFDLVSQSYLACQVRDVTTDICTGKFGIREPSATCPEVAWTALNLIVVPGVAFDLQGRRLGRGRGFFDRLLTQVHGTKCGVAFDEQIVEAVPIENHDTHMDSLVTPTLRVNCKD